MPPFISPETIEWLFRYTVTLKIAFAVVTLLVSILAFRYYTLTGKKQLKMFGTAFLLLFIAYIINFVVGIISRTLHAQFGRQMMRQPVTYLVHLVGNYGYAFLFTIGLVLLAIMALKITDKRVMFLVGAIALVGVSVNVILFELTAALLLGFVAFAYYQNYSKRRKVDQVLVTVAFVLLCLAHLQFVFPIMILFIIGDLVELIAYYIILYHLLSLKK
jgi:hypothetical protein